MAPLSNPTDFSRINHPLMKLILALPAISLLFSGLTTIPTNRHFSPACVPTPEPTTLPTLWVDKVECFKDESIELHFALPHATSLGMIDPDGKFFYLVFPAECTIGNLKPLVSSEDFGHLNALTIWPATLKADPYIYGVLENQPVFTKSGVYRFILGDNLHVDDEHSLNMVSVRYKHKKRPVSASLVQN